MATTTLKSYSSFFSRTFEARRSCVYAEAGVVVEVPERGQRVIGPVVAANQSTFPASMLRKETTHGCKIQVNDRIFAFLQRLKMVNKLVFVGLTWFDEINQLKFTGSIV